MLFLWVAGHPVQHHVALTARERGDFVQILGEEERERAGLARKLVEFRRSLAAAIVFPLLRFDLILSARTRHRCGGRQHMMPEITRGQEHAQNVEWSALDSSFGVVAAFSDSGFAQINVLFYLVLRGPLIEVEAATFVILLVLVESNRRGEDPSRLVRVCVQLVRSSRMVLVKRREVIKHPQLLLVIEGFGLDRNVVGCGDDTRPQTWCGNQLREHQPPRANQERCNFVRSFPTANPHIHHAEREVNLSSQTAQYMQCVDALSRGGGPSTARVSRMSTDGSRRRAPHRTFHKRPLSRCHHRSV
jgi:hypothetical protein